MPSSPSAHTCRICSTETKGNTYTVREMMYGFRDEFLYFQCPQCECLQIAEIPANIGDYYPSEYYSFKPYEGGAKFKGLKGKLKVLEYQSSLAPESAGQQLIGALFPTHQFKDLEGIAITRESRILDVGCGNGDKFLYPMAEMGYKNLLGCDPYLDQSITYPNGLHIQKADVFGIEGTWDIIIYHHAFEHVPNPLENLQQVKRLLAKDGVCVISIPTVSSYAWKHYGTNWYQLDAPRHFFLHSVKSMDFLARAAGLVLDRMVSDSDYRQFTFSEGYLRDIPIIGSRNKGFAAYVRRKFEKIKYNRLARRLNAKGEGDIGIFYLKKA